MDDLSEAISGILEFHMNISRFPRLDGSRRLTGTDVSENKR